MFASRLALIASLMVLIAAPGFAQTPPAPPAPAAVAPAPAAPPAMPPFVPPGTDVSVAPAGIYAMDKNHATIGFKVLHLGFSLYNGRFNTFDSTINLVDPKAPEKSVVDVTIDMSSIDTHNPKLEGELREWFKAAQFPNATFHSTKFTRTGPTTGTLDGDFTMAGQTHPVSLAVTLHGYGLQMMTKKPTLGFTATGTLKRSQWGINQGLPMVGDDVVFQIDAEFNKAEVPAAAAPAPVPVAPPAPVAPAPAKP